MKYFEMLSLGLLSSLLALSCSKTLDPNVSETKEGIDRNSSLDQLGDVGSPTYNEILQTKAVVTPRLPWTDTYWPLTEKGLSRRWSKSEKVIGLAEFFSSQTIQNKEKKVDSFLSPAEKYDILFRWRHSLAINETQVAELVKNWDVMESSLDMNAEISATKKTIRASSREFDSKKLEGFRKEFPMSSDGWDSWLTYSSSDQFMFGDVKDSGEDWSWMGSCHGWAPAALMAETPKHSVLVKFDDREVMLSEGDIRGLLTKSWADHSPRKEQYFVGRRCNKNSADPVGEIPHSAAGRGYYGEITRGDVKTPFNVKSEIYATFIESSDRIYPLSYDDKEGVQGFLLETYSNNAKRFYLGQSLDNLRSFVENGDDTKVETLSSVEMFGCWDVNPATFHVALVQKVGKEGVGLVIDRTRTGQVWNQPVYSATFNIAPLVALSDLMKEGNPALGTRDREAFRRNLAPGTKSIAVVNAKVLWISEPAEQKMDYTAAFDKKHSKELSYDYLLEFDRNGHLIGGEWGTLAETSPKQVTPDFIFGFDKGSKPVDDIKGGFDFSGIVGQIHDCSLSETIDGTMKVGTYNLEYSNCVLTKAP
ncbi:MAG: hypothetical protein H7318_15505 [Oligoflexus sp.]|nr:hypothetical protein [Oligoflexus sp.]